MAEKSKPSDLLSRYRSSLGAPAPVAVEAEPAAAPVAITPAAVPAKKDKAPEKKPRASRARKPAAAKAVPAAPRRDQRRPVGGRRRFAPSGPTVRFSLDLETASHKQLKLLAIEHEVDAVVLARLLVTLLHEDAEVEAKLAARLNALRDAGEPAESDDSSSTE